MGGEKRKKGLTHSVLTGDGSDGADGEEREQSGN